MIKQIKSIYQNRTPHILGHEKLSKAAVMVPLVDLGKGLSVLFQVRGHRLRHQPGEICFPGGRLEPADHSEEAAAVRETCEELGIERTQMEVIAPLDIFVTTHTIIYPFLGQLEENITLRPDPQEVAEVFTVPMDFLLTHEPMMHHVSTEIKPPDDFPFHLIPGGKYYKWRRAQIPEYFYIYEDKVIWGLTARILHDFLDKVKKDIAF